jgi:hypothetical protein
MDIAGTVNNWSVRLIAIQCILIIGAKRVDVYSCKVKILYEL